MTRSTKLFDRRDVLKIGAGAGVLGASAHFGIAARPAFAADFEQAPGFFRFALDEMTVTIVSDGHLEIPASVVASNIGVDELRSYLSARFLDTDINYGHTNHVLIETGEDLVLVDVGSGERFQPTAGKLVENLDLAGYAPEDVTKVVLTHAHPDHVWGMLDEFEDDLRFPEAEHIVGAAEFDWWMAADRVASLPDDLKPFAVGAQQSFEPIADRLVMAKDGLDVATGCRLIATPGHTPGHMSLIVESGDQTMLVAGDAINHGYVAFEHPDWRPAFDFDKDLAVATRKRLLEMCASDRMLISAYHLPFPGVGHAARAGQAYRYMPALWRW
ncbi:MAG: MBL fold metallo-hydrolase [Pseudomonadota bacterium]